MDNVRVGKLFATVLPGWQPGCCTRLELTQDSLVRLLMHVSTEMKTWYAWYLNSARWMDRLAEVNRELWLVLSLFVIAGLLNWLITSHGMVLGFYTIPTLFSAYVYGPRRLGL